MNYFPMKFSALVYNVNAAEEGVSKTVLFVLSVIARREDGESADAKLLSPHPRLISLRIRITGPPPQWPSVRRLS